MAEHPSSPLPHPRREILKAIGAHELAAARAWIADCTWRDLDEDLVAELTDEDIIAGVERHFDGGGAASLEAEGLLSPPLPTPRSRRRHERCGQGSPRPRPATEGQ